MKILKILLFGIGGVLGISILLIALFAAAFLVVNKTNGHLVSSGEERSYLLYVPDGYDPATPTPLVIVIHGFAQWPANQQNVSGWNKLADKYNFIVVYPSGTSFPKRWRSSGMTTDGSDPQVDVKFISDLIDKLKSQYNIDPHRIYSTGLSNGGGMTFMLTCDLSDRIAAAGTVAGAYTLPFDQCAPSRPVPLMVFHGTADPIVPFFGGPSHRFNIPFPNIADWVRTYAIKNGCSEIPNVAPSSGNDVTEMRYEGCHTNADVVYYVINGGGHTWPGGKPLPKWITGPTTQSINASELMWQFFVEHPLP
jgi:polyhydroxybutyrate depolymerase